MKKKIFLLAISTIFGAVQARYVSTFVPSEPLAANFEEYAEKLITAYQSWVESYSEPNPALNLPRSEIKFTQIVRKRTFYYRSFYNNKAEDISEGHERLPAFIADAIADMGDMVFALQLLHEQVIEPWRSAKDGKYIEVKLMRNSEREAVLEIYHDKQQKSVTTFTYSEQDVIAWDQQLLKLARSRGISC